jgi:O-antigen ligase
VSISQDRPVIVRRGLSGLVYSTRAVRVAVSPRKLPLIVGWLFLLFIVFIAYERATLTMLSGFLFFAVYFLYHNPLARERSLPAVPHAIIWFMGYVAVYALNGLFLPTVRLDDFLARLFTLVQVIIFLWIVSDILKDENMAKKALLAYSITSVILAFGFVFSLPGFDVIGEVGDTRASAIGVSANLLASITALAVVALLGLWLGVSHKGLTESVWMFGSMFVLALATVYTGSRGNVVMLMAGLSVYLVPYWKKRWRMSNIIVAVIAMAGLAYVAAKTPAFYERWQAYSEEGNTSGRDKIYEAALDMISERPLLGWQPVEFWYELGFRVYGSYSQLDAHHTYLHLFMEVGMIGAVPFLIGLWLCGKGAWKGRNRNLGLLPLALLVTALAGSMTSTWIYRKTFWFVLAVAVAATAEKKRQVMILGGRPIENGMQTSSRKLHSSTAG